MLKETLTYLNTVLGATGYFGENYGLVVLVRKRDGDNDVTFPAEYCGNGEYRSVADFDQENGATYWRLRSEITDAEVVSVGLVTNLTRRTYPLKLVCVVKRSTISQSNDNAYTEDKLSIAIQKQLRQREKSIKTLLGAQRVQTLFRSVQPLPSEIVSSEFINIEIDRRSLFVMMSIDLDIIVDIARTCIDDFCDADVDVDAFIRAEVIDDITADPSLVTDAQELAIQDAFCEACDGIDITINGEAFLSDVTENTDIEVKNTDETNIGYRETLPTVHWMIRDTEVTIEDQDGNELGTGSVVAEKSGQVIEVTVTPTVYPIAYARERPSQTTSYITGDAAWLAANGYFATADMDIVGIKPILASFTVLHANTPNKWGNTNRFTDDTGAQTYTTGIIQDHYTGIEWMFDGTKVSLGVGTGAAQYLGNGSFAAMDAAVRASTYQGGEWRLPTEEDWDSIIRFNASSLSLTTSLVSYSPFNLNFSGVYVCASVNPDNTGQAMRFHTNSTSFFDQVAFSYAIWKFGMVRWIQ